MDSPLTDRRAFVEQRLFDIQVEIERAENEVEFVERQLATIQDSANVAVARFALADTAVADQARTTTRSRLREMRAAAALAQDHLGTLVSARDDLLAKLLG